MSILMAFEWYYFQAILNWWHSPFKAPKNNVRINYFMGTWKLTLKLKNSVPTFYKHIEMVVVLSSRPRMTLNRNKNGWTYLVLRRLTLQVLPIERSSFHTELMVLYFYIYRELPLSMVKNRFQQLKPKYVAYPSMRCTLQITDSRKPISWYNKLAYHYSVDRGNKFPHCHSNELCSISMPIAAINQSGKPITTANCRTGFQQKMRENYQPWMWKGFPLPFLCSRLTVDVNEPQILAKAVETSFLQFKSKSFKLIKKISAIHCERKAFQLIQVFSPVNSC